MPKHAHRDSAERLRRVREHFGLSQRDLANELGVVNAAVTQWERGERSIPGPVVKLLELYEEEAGLVPVSASAMERAALPVGRLSRTAPTVAASLLWIAASRLVEGEPANRLGKRMRTLALERAAARVGRLKGLGMKLAQMVSYMDFAMSDERRALLRMATSPPPMPPHAAARLVTDELGRAPRQLFASWRPVPFAVASIGQVHRAVLHDGRAVAVKLQYPRMVEALETDLENLEVLDRFYTLVFRGQKRGVLHQELRDRFLEECDYRAEARNQELFAAAFGARSNIRVPEVVKHLSTGRVLTSTFEHGLSLDEFRADASAKDRNQAGETIWEFYFESIFRHGIFQADPNPANFIFQSGAIAFVDFGRTKRFSPDFLADWRRLLRATMERNKSEVSALLESMGIVAHPRFDFDYAYRALLVFYRPWLRDEPFTFSADYLHKVWRAIGPDNVNLARFHFPADLALTSQFQFGVNAVLARLGARVRCRAKMLALLYEPGERLPPPFTATELGPLARAG